MSELAQKSGKLRKVALRRRHAVAPDDDNAPNQRTPMPDLRVGCAVRVYYDEDTYDEGEVTLIEHGSVLVDFDDWTERWDSVTQFTLTELYFEQQVAWVPRCEGTVVTDFRLTNPTKPL